MRVDELPVEMTRTGDERVPRRILAVFDGSPGAWTALERAIRIAERERALLTIAAPVPEPNFWVGCGLVSVPYTREGLREDALRAMERELAAARDEVPATVSLTTRLLRGRPRAALRRLERSGNFDLVIAPGRRRRRSRHVRTPQASSRSPASVLAMKPT